EATRAERLHRLQAAFRPEARDRTVDNNGAADVTLGYDAIRRAHCDIEILLGCRPEVDRGDLVEWRWERIEFQASPAAESVVHRDDAVAVQPAGNLANLSRTAGGGNHKLFGV